jgi:hypothetical protein
MIADANGAVNDVVEETADAEDTAALEQSS